MYLLRLQPRQPVADGAHHLDRLRRRRRHRGDRERHPLHRAGRAAAARRRSRARGRSASPSCRSPSRCWRCSSRILLMGGIVGRLFREFAVTLSVAIALSARGLADADADDVLAPAAPGARREHGPPLHAAPSACFDRAAARLRPRACAGCSATGALTLARRRSATARAHRRTSSWSSPKGLFPQQDTGTAHRLLRGARRTSRSPAMKARQEALNAIVRGRSRRRPRRRRSSAAAAASAGNTGTMFIALKPRARAQGDGRRDHRAAAPQARRRSRASTLFLQSRRRTCASAGASSRTQYQYTLRGRRPRRAARVGAEGARPRCGSCPSSRDVATDQQTAGLQLERPVDRDTAARLGRHAAGDRRHALRRVRPAPGRDHRTRSSTSTASSSRCSPSSQRGPEALDALVRASRERRRQVPLVDARRSSRPSHDPAVDQPPGPVPGGHALVQPGARRRRSGRRSTPIDARRAADRPAGQRARRSSRARRRPSAPRSAAEPLLILAALLDRLHRARHALREPHPPDHDPLDAALGGRGRAARAAARCRTELSIIALIGIILLIGIVKKNAIMMIDFAHRGRARPGAVARATPSTRPACCASGRS